MSDFSLEELEEWDQKICDIAKSYGLDWYPIAYETINFHEMIGAMSYHGLPSHYSHWSYGKTFERTRSRYNAGLEGLPYELIINSNPSIAYLMLENSLYLQILIMAHCVGHSDFFKNNRTFKDTEANTAVLRFKNAKNRIQKYIEDPSIGVEEVEKVLDACHSVSYQTDRRGRTRMSESQLREKYANLANGEEKEKWKNFDLQAIPLEPEFDVLLFVMENNKDLTDWQKDIINIVREESQYFWPQIRTKVMNEGWASFWHYRILHDLELPDRLHVPFIKSHNAVIRPSIGSINPYHVGFELFKGIEKRFGLEECFFAREQFNDESFIRQYLTREKAEELGLFTYGQASRKNKDLIVKDVMDDDEDSWNEIKSALVGHVAGNKIPVIYVEKLEKDKTLILRHEHDGRDLELDYADNCVKLLKNIWNGDVVLHTIIEDEPFEIS